ncbi:MAG: inorganic phosphate transporter [Gammaproteobacteria bacterium]
MAHETLLLILTAIFSLTLTWGVGANDLANVLSPSLGSKAIRAGQAITIAIIFELAGALLGGSKVAATVQHGIVNTDLLILTPNILIYGMIASLIASSFWITTASRLGIPVSLTNSIVGSVLGFGALVLGWHAVHWKMVGFIGLSWIACPCLAGLTAYFLFSIVRKKILSAESPISNAQHYLPIFLFIVGIILTEIMVLKALKHFSIFPGIGPHILIAVVGASIVVIFGKYFLKRVYNKPYNTYKEQLSLTEKAFAIMLVFTACAMVYAHGSDDIATATGPVAAVVSLTKTGTSTHNGNMLLAILAFGYLGVIIGFLTYGRRVIATIGSSLTELTPSRAFCATLAASSIVLISTNIGIPVSATQTLVGAIVGVGLARGIEAIDLRIVRNIFTSWFITIPVTATLTVLFFYICKFFFH